AMEANPYHARSTLLLGLLLDRRGQPARAAEVVDRTLAIRPRSPELLRLGATLQDRLSQDGTADALWRRLLEVSPGDAEAQRALATGTATGS
ncbi:MAG: hypothetical protein ACREMG_04065, partial [Gemmatimonadales bacterium]